jgi:hypothetical protein
MTTPTGRHEDEPIDGPVRQLLWRLRARMVTPSSERRANADLDRLIALARVQAHEAPSAGAMANPGAGGGPAIALPPDHPVVHVAADGVGASEDVHRAALDLPVEVDELAERRGRFTALQGLTRVAAAAMVFVAFGAGLAGARDGSVTLTTLFGRDEVPEVDPMALQPDVIAPPAGNEPTDDTGADDIASEVPLVADGGDAAGSGAGDATASDDTDPDVADATDPAPTAPKPTEPTRTEEQIVAAPPPPDDLLGSGGPTPCDQPDLADCLPADDADGEPSDDSGADEPSGDTQPVGDEAEELAKRRFGGAGS